ncbi:MAG: hypothetical protein COB02_16095 [Candidatus Cloacimonadota bacterium]|nr:MAG: hypothetical protein COB02_16095 [Candidatus Cloacimonadota bacterium]
MLKIYFFFFLNTIFISFSESILNDVDFYYEYAQSLNEANQEKLNNIIDKGVIGIWKDPRYKKILLSAEKKGLLKDFVRFKSILSVVVKLNLLKKTKEKRYFYMRESIRRIGHSSISTSVEKAVEGLVNSDLIAVLVDSQFRVLVAPLIKSGYLKKYFKVVGDLEYFNNSKLYKEKWDELFKKYSKVNYKADAKIISLMEIVSDESEEVKKRARNVRNSRYYDKENSEIEKEVLSSHLYSIYNSYIKSPKWVDFIQVLTEKDLLFVAIERAEKKVSKYFQRIIRKNTQTKDSNLQDFFRSKVFFEFMSADGSPKYFFLNEEKVLLKLVQNLDEISFLLKQAKTPLFKEALVSLILRQNQIKEDRSLIKKKKKNLGNCYANMSLMMKAREYFSLETRKEVKLRSEKDRKYFFEKSGLKKKICPSGGKYLSSEYGRIQCTYHGDAPITLK